MTGRPAESFWDYSLETYSRAGVAPACLRLQDRLGADVNLILFGCWIASCGGGRMIGGDWMALSALTDDWRTQVVEPLRAIRRHLKVNPAAGIAPSLRTEVIRLELEAEHAEQLILESQFQWSADTAKPEDAKRADAKESLTVYFDILESTPGPDERADLEAILAGCFP